MKHNKLGDRVVIMMLAAILIATLCGIIFRAVVGQENEIPFPPYPGPSDNAFLPNVQRPYPGPGPTPGPLPTTTPSRPPGPDPCNICWDCAGIVACYEFCMEECGCGFSDEFWPDSEWLCPFFPPDPPEPATILGGYR